MKWNELQAALQKMRPTGPNGFEGIAAICLEEITGERFLIARAGDQPEGDAGTTLGHIRMQVKRYTSAKLTEAQVETDFHSARRASPHIEVYVLVVTKPHLQLVSRLDSLRAETGIDIVMLDWSGNPPTLGALCVAFWSRVAHFKDLSALGDDFAAWATKEAQSSDVQSRVRQIRTEIETQLSGFRELRLNAEAFLRRRFGLQTPATPRYRIQLESAVKRNVSDVLANWWACGRHTFGVLVGEEGMGKSWLGAAFAFQIATAENALVFWLESDDWNDCKTLEDLVAAALRGLGYPSEDVVRRLINRILRCWGNRVLIVVDGANEGNALPAAQKLIANYVERAAPRAGLLFITRPLEDREAFRNSFWSIGKRIEVGPFDDSELSSASALVKPPLQVKEIPPALLDFARIPRFFATCVRLRQRFGNLHDVTRELVLWADLVDRIEHDTQIREVLRWTKEADAADVLMSLARKVEFKNDTATAAYHVLDECFNGRYEGIRRDLTELRIAELATPQKAQLNRAHVILGFALYLEQLTAAAEGTPKERADIIQKALEPLASVDERTEAVFVSLQLTALKNDLSKPSRFHTRSALLLVWASLHNRYAPMTRLKFWAEADTEAYATFVDAFFEELESGGKQTDVVEPLAKVWQTGKQDEILSRHIERWLLLAWTGDAAEGVEEIEHDVCALPLARTEQQLRLSSVALSFVSLRPELKWLRLLAIARATLHLSTVVRRFNDPQGQQQEARIPLKGLHQEISHLMRWSYTEQVIPDLVKLAETNHGNKVLTKGLKELARGLLLRELPDELQLPESDNEDFVWLARSPQELIRQGKTLFPQGSEELYPSTSDFGYLTIRDDLPDLLSRDIQLIAEGVEKICAETLPHNSASQRLEDAELDRWWPWYARYFPTKMPALATKLREAALDASQPLFTLIFLRSLLADVSSDRLADLREKMQQAALRFLEPEGRCPNYVLTQLWTLALLELSACAEQLAVWMRFASEYRSIRWAVDFYPAPLLVPQSIPRALADFAFDQCRLLAHEPPEAGQTTATCFDYWCSIASRTVEPSTEKYEWVKYRVKELEPTGDRQFHWMLLLFRCAPSDLFATDFANGVWPDLFRGRAWRALQCSGHKLGNIAPRQCAYEQLLKWLPKDFVGSVLRTFGRDEDFKTWGISLLSYARNQIGKAPSRNFQGRVEYSLDENGVVNKRRIETPERERRWSRSSPSVWGVDAQGATGLSPEEWERVWKAELDLWQKDERNLENWEGCDLHDFSARRALKDWRKKYPNEFLILARQFMNAMEDNPAGAFHLGCFADAVICSLVGLDADDAWQRSRRSSGPYTFSNCYNVSTLVEALWDTNDCDQPVHRSLRARLFEQARTEAEIVGLVRAALSAKGETELWRIIDSLCEAECSKDRALAVSILAWVGDTKAIDRLAQLQSKDLSEWVAEHSEWANEVARGEDGARRFYRRLLDESDPVAISVGLQVLEPALTPMATWWHVDIEQSKPNRPPSDRGRAIIEAFWYHQDSTRKSSEAIYGRSLEGYCRGEKIDSIRSPLLAPWWNP